MIKVDTWKDIQKMISKASKPFVKSASNTLEVGKEAGRYGIDLFQNFLDLPVQGGTDPSDLGEGVLHLLARTASVMLSAFVPGIGGFLSALKGGAGETALLQVQKNVANSASKRLSKKFGLGLSGPSDISRIVPMAPRPRIQAPRIRKLENKPK